MATSAPKRVLVLDGGCIRGLGCLLLLEELSKKIDDEPYDFFDLICGSGCGGLLAILLGRLRMDCHTAISAYKKLAFALCGTQAAGFHKRLVDGEGLLDVANFDKALAEILDTHLTGANEMVMGAAENNGEAKTFVTTVHNNSNHVYQIRTYPTPTLTLFEAPPKPHTWTVFEAAKAAFACPFFMGPLSIDGRFRYSDSGFAGLNNPIMQASDECQKLWGSQQAITFVSLGTSLTSVITESSRLRAFELHHPSEWDSSTYLSKKQEFSQMAERLSVIARETETAAMKGAQRHDELKECLRVDPCLEIPEAALCDIFYEADIRRSINNWIQGTDGVNLINKLFALVPPQLGPVTISRAEMEEKIKQAQLLDVPKPDPDTVNANYNPELDRKRPTNIDDYLRRYHVLFVLDDSRSMKGKLWKEAQEALKKISDYAVINKTAKVELVFLNNPHRIAAVQGRKGLLSIFESVSPQRPSFSVENFQKLKSYVLLGGTPTGERLRLILDEHMNALDAAVADPPAYSSIYPLDIIVITDGKPTDDPAAVMKEAVQRMRRSKHHPNCVGVQFVQIGNDKKAKRILEALVHGENGSMVDTVPYNGVLTPERLERILLGGLHPNVRALIL